MHEKTLQGKTIIKTANLTYIYYWCYAIDGNFPLSKNWENNA